MTSEPRRLSKGKRFHRHVQAEWTATAEGHVRPEAGLIKSGGRRGRADILVNPDEKMVAVVEIKGTDWDRMTVRNVRANVRRHARQVWIYIDSLLQAGKEVCPGIIFPRRPKTPDRLEFIESLFDEQGIPVVWQDEAIEDCRNRNSIVKKPR